MENCLPSEATAARDHDDQLNANGLPSQLPMPSGRSLLLDLPAELRNRIYDFITLGTGHLNPRTKRLSPSRVAAPLARVSKQVHAELIAFINLHVPQIVAVVRNLSFANLVSFLNHNPDAYMRSLPKKGKAGRRKFIIRLTNTSHEMPALSRWINRFGTAKPGTDIDFSYEAIRCEHENFTKLWDRQVQYEKWYQTLCDDNQVAKASELDKVIDALKVWPRKPRTSGQSSGVASQHEEVP